ncbi:MAG: ABC transporter ATP-binding protein [Alphaproteobacteria bacterium]|jgi:ABC-type multidrug transport system fused ATPase/permease subunit|nr:ABC transporter ATP-binding protein [Alphaproteobacteria bacterium]
MSQPSKTSDMFPALQKIRELLSREDKKKCIVISIFALFSSLFELLTASIIVLFARLMSQMDIGQQYAAKIGFENKFSNTDILIFIVIACALSFFIKNIIAGFELFHQNLAIQKMEEKFKHTLLHRYAKIDYGFYLTRNSSTGLTIINNDARNIYTSGVMGIAGLLSEIIVFVNLIGFLIYMQPTLAFFIFGCGIILSFLLSQYFMPVIYNYSLKMQEANVKSYQHLLQFFHSFKEIALLGKREYFIKNFQLHNNEATYAEAIRTAVKGSPRLFIETLFVGLFMIAIGFMAIKSQNPTELLGVLGGYLYVGFRIMPGLNRIIQQINMFKGAIPSINRIHHEYNLSEENERYLNLPNFHFEKSIDLKNLSFQYLNTRKSALTNINLTIKKGECIGIAGETGSGKSTLVDMILGLLKPTEGEILIDSLYPANSLQWHQKIGYVPQSLNLIDDTIAANIAFGVEPKDHNVEQLHKVIEAAQLSKLLAQLPEGVNTIVGERGVRLSGGEKQRIAIARALYINPEVLIFDEATSALDNETEAKLMETIYSVSKNRTVIMIAHRLSTLEKCDRIVQMCNSELIKILTYKDFEQQNHKVIPITPQSN